MMVTTSRFGNVEVPEETLITLPQGMVGFPSETRYAWIPHRNSSDIAWLQSIRSPHIAFPMLNAECVGEEYPELPLTAIADLGGVPYASPEELALLLVLTAHAGAPPVVNLMAPVVINSVTRVGAQVVLATTRVATATYTRRGSTAGTLITGAP